MAARKPRAKPASAAPSNTIAARLARAGIKSDWDFVLHLPLRYEDETQVTPIADLVAGNEAQVEAEVVAADVVYRGRRQLRVTVRDDSGQLTLRFLNFYSSQATQMAVGRRLRISEWCGRMAGDEMIHPRVRASDIFNLLPQSLTPVYPHPRACRILSAEADRSFAARRRHRRVLPAAMLERIGYQV